MTVNNKKKTIINKGHGLYKNLKTNTYSIRFRYKDSLGRDRQTTLRGFATQSEAFEAKEDYIIKKNKPFQEKPITFEELVELYVDYKQLRNKKSTSITNYSKIKNNILPYFNNQKVGDIKVAQIEEWQSILLNEKKLSVRYIKQLHQILTGIFQYAVKNEFIEKNPAAIYGNLDAKTVKKKIEYWTFAEWKEFESVLDDDDYGLFFKFLYYTGAREGEALALQFKDFSKSFSFVYIRKTITKKTGGNKTNSTNPYDITTVKTQNSERRVMLPDHLKKELKEHQERCQKRIGYSPNAFVFGFERPLSLTTVTRIKNRKCEEAGVKQIRIHDFRHSHASLLINNGVNVVAVADRLGHSSPDITLRVYSHFFKDEKERDTVNMLNSLDNN